MLEIALIRHSSTFGNTLKRYIGTTDEPLCKEGIELLKRKRYPSAEAVFVSPLTRCVQTARLIYPEHRLHIIEDLAECNFGEFENKNYMELEGNAAYQAWIDSNGQLPFPGGESRGEFRERTLRGFRRVVDTCFKLRIEKAAVICHGGSIMNIMEAYAQESRDFYGWHVGNAQGYTAVLDQTRFRQGKGILKEIKLI